MINYYMFKQEEMEFKSLDDIWRVIRWKNEDNFVNFAEKHKVPGDAHKYFQEHVIHDIKRPKPKWIPIVSKHLGGYQMDTFINDSSAGGLNYLFFININTRMGYAYPMKGKGAYEVHRALEQFIKDVPHVYSITSDQDAAYLSQTVLDFMREHQIFYRTTDKNNHNVLGMINRFMRTIRDMVGDNRYIDEKLMKQVMYIYNRLPNRNINKAPIDMTREDEIEYIKRNSKANPYHFKPEERVRIVAQKSPFGKNRNVVSPESFIIDSKEGNEFLVRAQDGSTQKFPGYRLVKTTDDNVPLASSLGGGKEGIIEEIKSYNKDNDTYRVKYEGVRGKLKTGTIHAKDARIGNPLVLGPREREFWLRQQKMVKKEKMKTDTKKKRGRRKKQVDDKIPPKIMKYI